MKLFCVTPSNHPFEFPSAILVVADNEEEAIEIAKGYFADIQLPLFAKEVPFKKGVVYKDINFG